MPPDDKLIWEIWMSVHSFPAMATADELGVFALLEKAPSTASEVGAALSLSPRATEALLGLLTSLGLLELKGGRFHNGESARAYLLPSSPYYWGGMLRFVRDFPVTAERMKATLLKDKPKDGSMDAMWASHEMNPDFARAFTEAMHSRSVSLAEAVAKRIDFSQARRLLDVAGGSGVFSTAIARAHPHVRCTVLELPEVAKLARRYGAVDVLPGDMWKDPWPAADVVFFSNIYHDWDRPRCDVLSRKAREALSPGGRILIHEIPLNDTRTGPRVAVADSMQMMFFTDGKQRSLAEFREILEPAGFRDVELTPTFGYYGVVSAYARG